MGVTTQDATLIAAILAFIVGLAGLWMGGKNSQKTNYINSVTSARLKYIQDLKHTISEFCGLVYSYSNKLPDLTDDQLLNFQREADALKYLIKLHLDPENKYWDKKILRLLDDIISLTDKNPNEKIEELITITQYLIKLEWTGVKLESQKEILSQVEKDSNNDIHVKLYEEYNKLQLQ
jgi:hypothetical protein